MNSRMEKYQSNVSVKERTVKNKKLYDEVLDLDVEYIDVSSSNKIEIDMNELSEKTRKNYKKMKEMAALLPTDVKEDTTIDDVVPKEERIYDINEILKQAKENRIFEEETKKRLINTEYNILTKLDINMINQKEDFSKENLRNLIDAIYQNEDEKKPKRKKREMEDDDLFADLKDTDEFVIDEELSKIILDRALDLETSKKKKNQKNESDDKDDSKEQEDKVDISEDEKENLSEIDSHDDNLEKEKEEDVEDETDKTDFDASKEDYDNVTIQLKDILNDKNDDTNNTNDTISNDDVSIDDVSIDENTKTTVLKKELLDDSSDNELEDTLDDLTDLIELENRKNRVWIFIIILFLAILLAVGGYYLYKYLSTF